MNTQSNRPPRPGKLISPTRARSKRTRAHAAGGFTLVEIMVVVVIIGVLAALIVPQFVGKIGVAKQNVAKQQIATLEGAINNFKIDYGRYPEVLRRSRWAASANSVPALRPARQSTRAPPPRRFGPQRRATA